MLRVEHFPGTLAFVLVVLFVQEGAELSALIHTDKVHARCRQCGHCAVVLTVLCTLAGADTWCDQVVLDVEAPWALAVTDYLLIMESNSEPVCTYIRCDGISSVCTYIRCIRSAGISSVCIRSAGLDSSH